MRLRIDHSLQKWLWMALTMVLLLGAFLAVRPKAAMDFPSYFFAGKAVSQNLSPYEITNLRALAAIEDFKGYVFPYIYPPFVAEVLSAVSGMSARSAQLIWNLFSLASLVGIAWLLSSMNPAESPEQQRTSRLWASLTVLSLAAPILHTLHNGQINLFVSLLVVLFFWVWIRGHFAFAGLFVAVAALVKITPLGFGLLLLTSGEPKRRISGVAVSVATLAVAVVASPARYEQFFARAREFGYGKVIDPWTRPAMVSNVGISGWGPRLFGDGTEAGARLSLLAVLAVGFSLLLFWRQVRTSVAAPLLLSMFVMSASPVMWAHHHVLLLGGLYLYLRGTAGVENLPIARGTLLALVFFMSLPRLRLPDPYGFAVSFLPGLVFLFIFSRLLAFAYRGKLPELGTVFGGSFHAELTRRVGAPSSSVKVP